ncbi:hypothetical protein HGG75_23200 [Ochrobactrum pseudogrignonense]|nr:hypothetical protein [Brucella pseudogrignonensis]
MTGTLLANQAVAVGLFGPFRLALSQITIDRRKRFEPAVLRIEQTDFTGHGGLECRDIFKGDIELCGDKLCFG